MPSALRCRGPETGFWEVRRGRRSVTGIHNGPLLENARQPARDRAGTPWSLDSLCRAPGLRLKKQSTRYSCSPLFGSGWLSGLLLLRSQLRPARPLRRSNPPSGCCRHSSFAGVGCVRLTFRRVLPSQSCPPSLLRERNFPPRRCGQSPTRPTRSASRGRSPTYSR